MLLVVLLLLPGPLVDVVVVAKGMSMSVVGAVDAWW